MCRVLAIIMFTLMQGCGTTASSVYLADGSKGYQIRCGAIVGETYGNCLAKAGSLCGGSGYTVVRQDSSNVFIDSIFVRCNAAAR